MKKYNNDDILMLKLAIAGYGFMAISGTALVVLLMPFWMPLAEHLICK